MRSALLVAVLAAGSPVALRAQGAKPVEWIKLPAPAVKDADTPLAVAGLAVRSDGEYVLVEATLKTAPKNDAGPTVRVYWDTDNNLATGAKDKSGTRAGFEFTSSVLVCIDEMDGSSTCSGQASKPKAYHAAAEVEKFKADDKSGAKSLVRGIVDAPKAPIESTLVQGKIAYADLGVKPGEAIRLAVCMAKGSSDDGAFFPPIRLRLK